MDNLSNANFNSFTQADCQSETQCSFLTCNLSFPMEPGVGVTFKFNPTLNVPQFCQLPQIVRQRYLAFGDVRLIMQDILWRKIVFSHMVVM